MRSIVSVFGRAVFDNPSESGAGSTSLGRQENSTSVPLGLVTEGEWVRIVALHGGRGLHDRLAGMGICVGGRLEVIRNRFDGKIVLGHEGSRLFLGGGMAQKIRVVIEGRST